MPMIEITLPEATFTKEEEARLAEDVTDALLRLEGMDTNPKARMLSWVYFHHHPNADLYIGGHAAHKAHYRFDVTVFENTLPDSHKERLTQALTQLVLQLEGTDDNRLNAARVWVLFHEVPDGHWGGAGQIYRLADLMKMMQR